MRRRIVLLLLSAGFCSADVAVAQVSMVQPIQWIVRESTGVDMWAYIAPDGETITFSRALDRRTFELLVTDIKGRQPQPFLKMPPAASLTRAAWSRRHRRLAFIGSASGDSGTGLYVADASGANVNSIPTKGLSGQFLYPSWMPDGRSVVVVDAGAPGGNTLFRVDLESGESSALTKPTEVLVGMPSVSPDGDVVAFAGQLNEGQRYDQTKNRIWLVPVAGGRPVEISAGTGRQPDWSPDGRWVAFTSGRDDPSGRHAIFVVDRAGGKLTQLTDHAVNPQHPVWSPNGKWLVFSAQPTERPDVFGLARIDVPKLPR
jgi:Tol biopolymer transport system component